MSREAAGQPLATPSATSKHAETRQSECLRVPRTVSPLLLSYSESRSRDGHPTRPGGPAATLYLRSAIASSNASTPSNSGLSSPKRYPGSWARPCLNQRVRPSSRCGVFRSALSDGQKISYEVEQARQVLGHQLVRQLRVLPLHRLIDQSMVPGERFCLVGLLDESC